MNQIEGGTYEPAVFLRKLSAAAEAEYVFTANVGSLQKVCLSRYNLPYASVLAGTMRVGMPNPEVLPDFKPERRFYDGQKVAEILEERSLIRRT